MSPPLVSEAALQRRVREAVCAADANRVWIAFSGGIDSTVLLHLTCECFPAARVFAVHVNHGLHPEAREWERFCRRTATRLGVAFRALRVKVRTQDGCGVEAAARDARYTALKPLLSTGDVLMLAHHADDQAETVLLQMLRGGGPEGLAAMPKRMRFGAGSLLRPLLEVPRRHIELFARCFEVEYTDDPANDDPAYDRNYLRREVAPLLGARWPAWQKTLSRVARHQAEACDLIQRLAEQRYRHCRVAGGALSAERCRALDDAEKKAVLRYWIKRARLPAPSEKQLAQLLRVLLSREARSGALVAWPGAEVRYYRGRLYALAPRASSGGFLHGADAIRWAGGTDLALPELDIELSWKQLHERAPELAGAEFLTVRLRCGGERYACADFHKKLKKVFQELGVPPWERSRTPLIYLDDELRLVWLPDPAGSAATGFSPTR